MNRYEMEITVMPDDIDEQDHVNNVRYLQWVQDVSKAHWCGVLSKQLSREYAWVVKSHHIDYKRPAFLGDRLKAITWIERFEGFISFRAVEIRNAETDRLHAKSMTQWCLYDFETKKPMRIPQEMIGLIDSANSSKL